MPFFEISGKIFETEYGPITEKEVFEAIDDMTAFYILSEGDFSDVRLARMEEHAVATAKATGEHIVRSTIGAISLPISVIPGPMGGVARKTVAVTAFGLELLLASNTHDAYLRSQIKKEIKRRVDRLEGRSA